jgi:hypothetical protein
MQGSNVHKLSAVDMKNQEDEKVFLGAQGFNHMAKSCEIRLPRRYMNILCILVETRIDSGQDSVAFHAMVSWQQGLLRERSEKAQEWLSAIFRMALWERLAGPG